MRPAARRRDERGIALSSPVALLSAAAVVLAGASFVATGGPRQDQPAPASAVRSSSSAAPAATASPPRRVTTPKRVKPVVRRGETRVQVFNNSGISGLAGSTAARAEGAGWQVVGSDNWYGTVDASTVYYPRRLRAHAELLGRDLGISRVKPVIGPMRTNGLTVILTSDYA
jgi:hypothetical protein